MASFRLVGIPQPMPVRDSTTGLVVDGYRIVVVSNATGARADIEIPKSLFTVAELEKQAEAHLAPLDEALAKFGTAAAVGE